jgi:tRNA pseudouridine-54 N-methylase
VIFVQNKSISIIILPHYYPFLSISLAFDVMLSLLMCSTNHNTEVTFVMFTPVSGIDSSNFNIQKILSSIELKKKKKKVITTVTISNAFNTNFLPVYSHLLRTSF